MNLLLLSVTNVLSSVMYIGLAILILMVMITIHELGHYVAGKIFKFKINEFSIGFGKALYTKKKKNGEVFSIRLIPLGGYCAFDGEDTTENAEGSFNSQAPWKRLIVLFSGAFFNFISAIIFSIVLLAVIGNGQVKINSVESYNLGADRLMVGDIVTEVEGENLNFLNGSLSGLISEYSTGEDIKLTIVRNGEQQEVVVQKYNQDVNGQTVAILGVTSSYENLSVGQSFLQAIPFSFEMAWECLVILGELLTGGYGLQDVGGPITTIGAIADASAVSLLNLLLLVPLIAVNLAVFNLLPIPALDGARMVFVIIEWIRGKPINREIEAKIHGVGLIALFGLVILIDLLHLFVF